MKKLVKLAAILVVLALIVVALRRLAKEHLEVKVARKHERPAAPPSDAPDSMPETSPEPSLATADPKEVEPVEAEPVAVDQQAETEPKADEEEEPEPEPNFRPNFRAEFSPSGWVSARDAALEELPATCTRFRIFLRNCSHFRVCL